MSNLIKVGMADLKASEAPDHLITYGLGSCVGVALYDSNKKIGGLAHIMLPSSTEISRSSNSAKFADTAIDALIDEIIRLGGSKMNLTAKIAGGAQMFTFSNNTGIMRIGEKNVIATKESLKRNNIRLVAEDTGGNFGRTVELDLSSGDFLVKTIRQGKNSL